MKKPVILSSLLLLLVDWTALTRAFVHHSPPTALLGPSRLWKRDCDMVAATKLGVVSTSIDPTLEAEVCSTMAHVALDFTGLLSPSKSAIRLFAVVGRLFAISADYLPDHSIHTEELTIQIVLLALALRELISERFGITASRDERG